jgi:hypothetical protein
VELTNDRGNKKTLFCSQLFTPVSRIHLFSTLSLPFLVSLWKIRCRLSYTFKLSMASEVYVGVGQGNLILLIYQKIFECLLKSSLLYYGSKCPVFVVVFIIVGLVWFIWFGVLTQATCLLVKFSSTWATSQVLLAFTLFFR